MEVDADRIDDAVVALLYLGRQRLAIGRHPILYTPSNLTLPSASVAAALRVSTPSLA